MQLQDIAQFNSAGGSDTSVNTGKKGLLIEMATPEHLIRMPKNFVLPKDTEFNLEYIKTKVQDGTFVPVIGASAFEDVSADDSYNTNSSGVKRLNLKGLIEHKFTFEEGHEFYKQMQKLEGFKSFSFAIGDDEGNWCLAKKSNGDYVGFTATHVTPERRMAKVKGGENEMKSIVIQYSDRKQWDENYDIFLAEYLDFTPEEIPTVNGVNTTIADPIAASDTTVSVDVVLASDNNTPVEGLAVENFVFEKEASGEAVSIESIAEGDPGKYALTLATGGVDGTDPVVVRLDGIVDQSGILYRTANARPATPQA